MSDSELDALFKDLDNFIAEFRSGEKITKLENPSHQDIIDRFMLNLVSYEKYKQEYITTKENANVVQRNITKTSIDVFAHRLRTSIDQLRAYGILHENQHTLKKCNEEKTELRRQLDEANLEIERLRKLALLHGINPDKLDDSFTAPVE